MKVLVASTWLTSRIKSAGFDRGPRRLPSHGRCLRVEWNRPVCRCAMRMPSNKRSRTALAFRPTNAW
jgi:hypothetical protein